jgi:hypothetical protein
MAHHIRQPMLRLLPFGMSWVLFLLLTSRAVPQDLGTIASGNKTSIEMIHTYYAEIRLDNSLQGKPYSRTAKYWRERGRIRYREEWNPTRTTDIEIVGDRLLCIPTVNGKVKLDSHVSGAVIADKNQHALELFAWEYSLFALPVGVGPTPPLIIYSLPEAVQKGRVKTLEWSEVSGRRLAHLNIELNPGVREYEVWVDPARNWLVTKCIHDFRPPGEPIFKLEYQVDEWAEPSPTIFVPTKVLEKTWFKGKLIGDGTIRMTDVRVNSPLPMCPPMPSLPAGTLVADKVQGGVYQIDGSGKRMGDFTPARDYFPIATTTDPPARSYFLGAIACVAAAFALFGAGLWWRKRRTDGGQ